MNSARHLPLARQRAERSSASSGLDPGGREARTDELRGLLRI